MEKLAFIYTAFFVVVIFCVGFTVISFIEWIVNLYGGICFGCD